MHDLLDGLDVLDVSATRGDLDVDVRSVEHDSREVAPGALFACIRGAVADGHAYAAAAVAAGAVGLLVERRLDVDVVQVRVPSVRAALGPVADRFHDHPSRALRVLGVTGTNGKTTVVSIVDAIARANGDRTGRIGTLGTAIGDTVLPPLHTTPEATELQASLASMRDARVGTVAMEVSSHALEQHRVDATTFTAVAYTNLSHEHLDYHGTIDAYFAAKARLFDGSFSDTAAISQDDSYGVELSTRARAAGIDVWTTAIDDDDADVCARGVELTPAVTAFTLVSRRDGVAARVESRSLLGRFNLANLLTAAALAARGACRGMPWLPVFRRPSGYPAGSSRSRPGSRSGSSSTTRTRPPRSSACSKQPRPLAGDDGAVVVVYGCGGDRDREKRPVMGAVAARLADRAILTSDNPRSEDPDAIIAAVLRGVPDDGRTVVEADRRTAIRRAIREAGPNDVIVIAGKGHETGQIVGADVRPFDDRIEAREALESIRCD